MAMSKPLHSCQEEANLYHSEWARSSLQVSLRQQTVTLPPEMELLAPNFWETSSGCVTGKGVVGSDIRAAGQHSFYDIRDNDGNLVLIWPDPDPVRASL